MNISVFNALFKKKPCIFKFPDVMLILILFTDQAQHENTEYICHKSQLVRMLINQLLRRWTGDEI